MASQGPGTHDADRIAELASGASAAVVVHPFDRRDRKAAARRLYRTIEQRRPSLVLCEGTGVGVGATLLAASRRLGVPYVISSGDAVAPFYAMRSAAAAPVGLAYERALMRNCVGFIGWTPYLTGRALTLGAPRAMTAAGWSDLEPTSEGGTAVRARHGLGANTLVVGIVGSLTWSRRRRYCYGLELVNALRHTRRADLRVLIVGDGDGRAHLDTATGGDPRVVLTGRVAHDEVADHLAAMDYLSLPQSMDGVGSFRYTIKLPEYAAAGRPILTGRLPFAYDLDGLDLQRIPGVAPWTDEYARGLAAVLGSATATAPRPVTLDAFDRDRQVTRVGAFIDDILDEARA